MLTCETLNRRAIEDALAEHGRWYVHLRCAIESGHTVFTPETTSEHCCELGWLLREDPEHYENLRTVHSDFHKQVGRILALAIRGHQREALVEFEANTHFANLSAALRKEMNSLARRLSPQAQINGPETTFLRN